MSSEATSPEHTTSVSSRSRSSTTNNSTTATPPPPSFVGHAGQSVGEQQQVPFQMIPPTNMAPPAAHFFANPFMNPYMATDVAQWQQQQSGQGSEAAPGQNIPNQIPGGFVISPAQYQEMMQQYFQQMMAASGAQFTIPFPMQFQQPNAFQNMQRPASQCSSSQKSETSERQHSVFSQPSPSREVQSESKEANLIEKASPSTSDVVNGSCEPTTAEATPESVAETSEPVFDDIIGDVTVANELKDDLNASDSPSDKRKLSGGSSASGGASGSGATSDRTDSLIRKQMNEIEKEITRRSQNKNIKKSGLPYTPPMTAEKAPLAKETLNQLRSSFNLAQDDVPTNGPTAVANNMFGANSNAFVAPQNAFPIGMAIPMTSQQPVTPYSTAPSFAMMPQQHNMFMQQQQHMQQASHYMNGATTSTNPFAPQPVQLPHLNASFVQQQQQHLNGGNAGGSAHFTPEQLAAVFAQQQIASSHVNPFGGQIPDFNMMTSPQQAQAQPSTSSAGIAPPPAPSHPIPRRSGSGWPEENKENGTANGVAASTSAAVPSTNGDEPVWVLRDSYLKKMQRDQRQSQEEELSWQEAASAAQAENGGGDEEEQETDRLLIGGGPSMTNGGRGGGSSKDDRRGSMDKKKNSKETMVHEPAVLIEGVLFRARYLGSTQMLCESRGSKAARMAQAQEAVARVKAPEGEIQPSTEIDLFISTEKIMVLNTDLQRISDTDVRQDILMDHALRTISYIADIGDLVVLMARRMSTSNSDDNCNDQSSDGGVRKTPKVICHVFESDEASFIAQSIGQAFQVAYVEFLRANGIDDPSYLRQIDYQEVLNSQELLGDELEMFAKKETQKEVVVPKKAGELLGIVVVESGWGSMLPTVVLAHMNPVGPAAHSNKLNIGDQIININGISLVGLPLSAAQTQIKNAKSATAVRMTVVSTPPVVEVRIRRPDTKYQLGFSVQNGVICSLLRGGIAERGGIRVGHRIIEINGTSVVAVAHDRIVNMLATAIGEIHMKTMPTSMFRLLTGQEQPQYI